MLKATERGDVVVRCRKQRNGPAFAPVTLRFDSETRVLSAVSRAAVPGVPESRPVSDSLREAVLGWVREHPARSTDVVARAIGRRKVDVMAALTLLQARRRAGVGEEGERNDVGAQEHCSRMNCSTVPGLFPICSGNSRRHCSECSRL